MSLLDKLGARKEAADFWAAVQYAEGEVPPETKAKIVKAGESLAWAIAWRALLKLGVPLGFLFTVGFTILGSQATGTVPPGVVQPTSVVTIARAPGASFDVAAFCRDPQTTVGRPVAVTDTADSGLRYIVSRGTEQVNWPDNPVGQNLAAKHYWTPPGAPQQMEVVEITKSAADCIKGKAPK